MTDTARTSHARTPNVRQRIAVVSVCCALLLAGGALAARAATVARGRFPAVASIRTDRPVDPLKQVPAQGSAVTTVPTAPADDDVTPAPTARPTASATPPRTAVTREPESDDAEEPEDDDEHETVTPEVRDDDGHEDDAEEPEDDTSDSH